MPIYTLCSDNIDMIIRRRYLRTDSNARATSVHNFHFYVVKDGIDFSDLGEKAITCDGVDCQQLLSLFPSPEDDIAMQRNIVVYNNLGGFKIGFDGVVNWHMKHSFYQEMFRKSNVVNG